MYFLLYNIKEDFSKIQGAFIYMLDFFWNVILLPTCNIYFLEAL